MNANETFYANTSMSTKALEGTQGIDTGWVCKTSLYGVYDMAREQQMYLLLNAYGMCGKYVPEVDWGRSGSKHIVIEDVNGCMTFADLANTKDLTPIMWLEICQAARRAIAELHRLGVCHMNLNGDNIMLKLTEGKWKAYIINWSNGESFKEDNIWDQSWDLWYKNAVSQDTDYLIAWIKDHCQAEDGGFLQVILDKVMTGY